MAGKNEYAGKKTELDYDVIETVVKDGTKVEFRNSTFTVDKQGAVNHAFTCKTPESLMTECHFDYSRWTDLCGARVAVHEVIKKDADLLFTVMSGDDTDLVAIKLIGPTVPQNKAPFSAFVVVEKEHLMLKRKSGSFFKKQFFVIEGQLVGGSAFESKFMQDLQHQKRGLFCRQRTAGKRLLFGKWFTPKKMIEIFYAANCLMPDVRMFLVYPMCPPNHHETMEDTYLAVTKSPADHGIEQCFSTSVTGGMTTIEEKGENIPVDLRLLSPFNVHLLSIILNISGPSMYLKRQQMRQARLKEVDLDPTFHRKREAYFLEYSAILYVDKFNSMFVTPLLDSRYMKCWLKFSNFEDNLHILAEKLKSVKELRELRKRVETEASKEVVIDPSRIVPTPADNSDESMNVD